MLQRLRGRTFAEKRVTRFSRSITGAPSQSEVRRPFRKPYQGWFLVPLGTGLQLIQTICRAGCTEGLDSRDFSQSCRPRGECRNDDTAARAVKGPRLSWQNSTAGPAVRVWRVSSAPARIKRPRQVTRAPFALLVFVVASVFADRQRQK